VERSAHVDSFVRDRLPPREHWPEFLFYYGLLRSPLGNLAAMDAPPQRAGEPGGSFGLSLETQNEAQAEEIFAKLSAGGEVTMPLERTFWAKKFGMCSDKFGIKWMVNYALGE